MAGCEPSSVPKGTRPLPRPIRGSREAPRLEAGVGGQGWAGRQGSQALDARGWSRCGAATPGTQRRSLPHRLRPPQRGRPGPLGARRRARASAPKAGAERQVHGSDYKSQHAQLP